MSSSSSSSCPVVPSPSSSTSSATGCPVQHAPPPPLVCDSSTIHMHTLPPSRGQCPVDHSKFTQPPSSSSSSSTPSSSSPSSLSIVGDVFPDSTPNPSQQYPLSTTPVASTIPKGGADVAANSTWVFPSPQRFYNAMKKKGWDPKEHDMAWVVSIHNTVNEQAWRKVMEYENMHKDSCATPKLVRFRGLPNELSLKARIMGWVGYVPPFDRHDWIVDRCGSEVRYIIDFYQGAGAEQREMLGLSPGIHLDVRPALSPTGIIDRFRMTWREWMQ